MKQVPHLTNLIKRNYGENVEILQEEIKSLTSPGENYGSIILAINLTVKQKDTIEKLNLVAKCFPLSEMLKEAFDSVNTFKKEALAYIKAIPTLINFQKEFKIPENKLLDVFPKCYGAYFGADNKPEDGVIFLENLKILNYDTGDRLIGFDLNQAKIIVSNLARFHAVTKSLEILKPELFKTEVMPCLMNDKALGTLPESIYKAMRESVLGTIRNVAVFEKYFPRIEKAVDFGEAELINFRMPSDEIWACMTHGDYWVNNVMLQKNSQNETINNKIVDLQFIRYDSPVRDLLFLAFTSFKEEVVLNNLDAIIKIYYEKFVEVLTEFKINLVNYSWDAFLTEIKTEAFKEFYHISFMFKFICTKKGSTSSLDNFHPNEWARMDLLGPEHKEKLLLTVSEFIKRNWI